MGFELPFKSIVALIVLVALLLEHGTCTPFNRSSFPDGFVFGSASSAYQVLLLYIILQLTNNTSFSLIYCQFSHIMYVYIMKDANVCNYVVIFVTDI